MAVTFEGMLFWNRTMPRRNVWLLGILTVVCLACHGRVERYGRIVSYAMNQIEHRFVEKVEARKLFEGALDGMMRQLQDKHSVYVLPKYFQEMKQTLEQEFGGLGIQLTQDAKTKEFIVATPLYGSPAYEAGIRAGDRILRIDGRPIQGLLIDEVTDLLRGKRGTAVLLGIQHEDEAKPVEIRIVRAVIHTDTVLGYSRNADGSWDYWLEGRDRIGYLRITTFGDRTHEEVKKAVEGLLAEGTKGLVLDLRDNPGGSLPSSLKVCNLFINSGVIVTIRGRDGAILKIIEATQEGTLADFPMAVLVNQHSASASEIVAACLQDHRRAVIVGARTYGKGTVQELIELQPSQGALKLTTASYWRPSEKNINRTSQSDETGEWGVAPDEGYQVKLEGEKLVRQLRWRNEHDLARPPGPSSKKGTTSQSDGVRFQTDVDPPLAKAVEYLEKEITRPKQGPP
jgi:carboxyl-terminal processing protease